MTVAGTQLRGGFEADVTAPPALWLIDLIRRHAATKPEAIAVGFGERRISYRELEERSNWLAHRLRGIGVARNGLVGLLVERSPEMVVGLLGILKSGGAYVPLDPGYPQARIEGMLADSGVGVLVTEAGILARLGLKYRGVVLIADEEGREVVGPEVDVCGENTAYVIFTSGSTGQPKGVEISHGSLLNVLWSLQREPGFGAGDAMLAVTSIAFDIAAAEIFLPLMVGGRVELASRDEVGDAGRLLEKVNGGRVTVLQATPVTWRLLVMAGWMGRAGLRVWCGGEEMTDLLAADLLARSSAVWNLYGPTETTIWSSCLRVEKAERGIPLGSPVANTSLFVLDEARREVGPEVVGELYIGGAGLAKGYWGREDLTATAFPTVRLGDGRSMRLYKTGDRVRQREDGQLQFLGRMDRQVKVRGFRIELGEIEATARGCAGVEEVVATVAEGGLLAAFAVGRVEAGALRMHLAQELPGYMVPAAIRVVERLPVTANWKLDRRQLASVTETTLRVLDAFDEPLEGMESRLAEIWGEALGVRVLGRHDNFFAVGGDSLLAAQVETEMELRVDRRCGVGSLLHAPTVALYTAFLEGKGVQSSVLLHAGRMKDDGIFWIDNPDRLPRLAGMVGDRSFYSMMLGQEEIAQEGPGYSLEGLAGRVVEHVLRLQGGGRFTIGGFCQNALLAYEVGQQLRLQGCLVGLLVLVDPGERFGTRGRGGAEKRLRREWFHLSSMMRLPFRGWTGYIRERIEGLRFEWEGRRWERAARGSSEVAGKKPRLAQALFASRLSYVPKAYGGRVLFIEPTERPEASKADGWRTLVKNGEWCSVAGNHLGLFASPAVEGMARAIRRGLGEG